MATNPDLDKIKSNPIKEGLNAFRQLFQSTCSDLSITASSDAVQVFFSMAAVASMAQLLLPTSLANMYSYQKYDSRPHLSSGKRISSSHPSFAHS
jgi:hypothetical protein